MHRSEDNFRKKQREEQRSRKRTEWVWFWHFCALQIVERLLRHGGPLRRRNATITELCTLMPYSLASYRGIASNNTSTRSSRSAACFVGGTLAVDLVSEEVDDTLVKGKERRTMSNR